MPRNKPGDDENSVRKKTTEVQPPTKNMKTNNKTNPYLSTVNW